MEFLVLGPVRVAAPGGRPEPVPGGQPRALLASLLLHANESVSAERIALALWGDEAPADSVRAVRVVVSRLRRVLGDEALTTSAAGYRLRVGPGELDSEGFDTLAGAAARALEAGDPQTADRVAREAL